MNTIKINTKTPRFPVAKDLYGLFFEDINRSGDGGLYPEMLRNRSFEDSIPPEGCEIDENHEVYINRGGWPDAFHRGEGLTLWAMREHPTPVPAWYVSNAVTENL